MGYLLQIKTGRRFTLGVRVLVGRSRKCDLHLPHPSISGEHAVVWWSEDQWWIRDLASRNGTTLDGDAVSSEQGRPMLAGQVLGFGSHPLGWTVESISEPRPMAVPVGAEGEVVVAEDGLLALPDGERPEVVVYEGSPQWILERGDQVRPTHDLDEVTIGERSWRLHLPQALAPTLGADQHAPLVLREIALAFDVSADEEHVAVHLEGDGQRIDLGSRAHHYMLLTLARARLADAELPAASQGWVYQDDLCQQLMIDRERINMLIFRARKQLMTLGVHGARDLVERRTDSQQLRLGVGRLRLGD